MAFTVYPAAVAWAYAAEFASGTVYIYSCSEETNSLSTGYSLLLEPELLYNAKSVMASFVSGSAAVMVSPFEAVKSAEA